MPLQKGGDVVIPESAKKLAQDSGRSFSKLLTFKKKDDAWCFREDKTLNIRHARPLGTVVYPKRRRRSDA